jgi:hypothetical protein
LKKVPQKGMYALSMKRANIIAVRGIRGSLSQQSESMGVVQVSRFSVEITIDFLESFPNRIVLLIPTKLVSIYEMPGRNTCYDDPGEKPILRRRPEIASGFPASTGCKVE